jgi:hypothetical protein
VADRDGRLLAELDASGVDPTRAVAEQEPDLAREERAELAVRE